MPAKLWLCARYSLGLAGWGCVIMSTLSTLITLMQSRELCSLIRHPNSRLASQTEL